MADEPLVLRLDELRREDVARVGGKNASLGEMIANLESRGIRVPGGFATTSRAYWDYLDHNDLRPQIADALAALQADQSNLAKIGQQIRDLLEHAEVPVPLADAVERSYAEMAEAGEPARVAVRSSATAEDLPEASFAGQLESFLNIQGERSLLGTLRRCYASLFTDRAIAYRVNNDFDHMKVALSVGVQRMVRADKAGSGVMFSIDTETGFPRTVLINAAWGLGELVVQGVVDPDEYIVFKPFLDDPSKKPIVEKKVGGKERKMTFGSGRQPLKTVSTAKADQHKFVLDDDEIMTLARWADRIEQHYGQPMDIEWAKDGLDGELYIVQARPETVQSQREQGKLQAYSLKERGEVLAAGLSVGASIGAGKVQLLESPAEIDRFEDGSVLVTGMTDPDWVPIMKKASAIVTDHGGRTSHAAIVSRELGLAATVGAGAGAASGRPRLLREAVHLELRRRGARARPARGGDRGDRRPGPGAHRVAHALRLGRRGAGGRARAAPDARVPGRAARPPRGARRGGPARRRGERGTGRRSFCSRGCGSLPLITRWVVSGTPCVGGGRRPALNPFAPRGPHTPRRRRNSRCRANAGGGSPGSCFFLHARPASRARRSRSSSLATARFASSIAGGEPSSRSRLVTSRPASPQGTIRSKWERSVETFSASPCIVPHFCTRTPIAAIFRPPAQTPVAGFSPPSRDALTPSRAQAAITASSSRRMYAWRLSPSRVRSPIG